MYIILVYIRLLCGCKYLMYSVYIPESCIYTTRDYDVTITPYCDYVVAVAFVSDDEHTRYCQRYADLLLTKV